MELTVLQEPKVQKVQPALRASKVSPE